MLWLRMAFVLKAINHNSQRGKGKLNFSPNPWDDLTETQKHTRFGLTCVWAMANTMTAMFTSRHLFLEGAYNEDNVLAKYQNPWTPNSGTGRPYMEKLEHKETTWDRLAFLTNSCWNSCLDLNWYFSASQSYIYKKKNMLPCSTIKVLHMTPTL